MTPVGIRERTNILICPEYGIFCSNSEGQKDRFASWWVDIFGVSLTERTAFLCEVTYSQSMQGIVRRLVQWHERWDDVRKAISLKSGVPDDWPIQPWVFAPETLIPIFNKRLAKLIPTPRFPEPIVTPLERTVPWLASAAKPSEP